MPHLRKRHAHAVLKQLISFSPLVGIFGHRQVGKTTFLESEVDHYFTLDDKKTLLLAKNDAEQFLASLPKSTARPIGIDECQFAEDLFPALKERVRKNKKPGQIVLSGSVRFYSRKSIRESLTGRIVNVDLIPMTLTEITQQDRSTLGLKLIKKSNFTQDIESQLSRSELKKNSHSIENYLHSGGLPGVCFFRNLKLQTERLEEQLLLILDRDLRLVSPSSVPYMQILDFVRHLTQFEGEPFQPSVLRKLTGLAEATQKKLLHALEAVYLVRILSIEGDRKGVCVYFEDQADMRHLHESPVDPLKAFEGLVYRNFREAFFYEIGLSFRFFQYRARPDVRIPFAVKTPEGCLGILPILTAEPTRKDIRMAHSFLQRYSPGNILIVTQNQIETKMIEPRILKIPAERLLFST